MAGDDDTLTWHDREVVTALRRLASARSRLEQLLEQGGPAVEAKVTFEDIEELERLEEEIAALAVKAKARFGGGAARERRATLQARQRSVLDRLGVADLDEARAAATRTDGPAVDPVVLDFARRELAAAEEAWEEIQAMDVPDQPEDPAIDLAAPDEAEPSPAIDLRVTPPTAS